MSGDHRPLDQADCLSNKPLKPIFHSLHINLSSVVSK